MAEETTEKRIAEKMNAIPGEVSVKVSNEVIIINTERKPSVIKPTLDFIKELVFILGISFNINLLLIILKQIDWRMI